MMSLKMIELCETLNERQVPLQPAVSLRCGCCGCCCGLGDLLQLAAPVVDLNLEHVVVMVEGRKCVQQAGAARAATSTARTHQHTQIAETTSGGEPIASVKAENRVQMQLLVRLFVFAVRAWLTSAAGNRCGGIASAGWPWRT